jgi:hypothetical protein
MPCIELREFAIEIIRGRFVLQCIEFSSIANFAGLARHQTAARRAAPRTLAREDVGQRVTTTRTTTTRQRIVAPPLVATTAAATPAYVSGGPRYYNFAGRPMDITLAAAPSLARQRAAPAVNSAYVYEADRILVIDPFTNLPVQAIPR